jgi:hypothetical protein
MYIIVILCYLGHNDKNVYILLTSFLKIEYFQFSVELSDTKDQLYSFISFIHISRMYVFWGEVSVLLLFETGTQYEAQSGLELPILLL